MQIGRRFGTFRDFQYSPMPYDAEIEYLSKNANTNAYIDTGIGLYESGKWEVVVKSSGNSGSERFMGGAVSSQTTDFWNMLGIDNYGNSMYPYCYGGYQWQDSNIVTINALNKNTIVYEFEPGNQKLYVNGTLHKQSSFSRNLITNNKNIYLFRVNENSAAQTDTRSITLYSVKMWNNSILVRDFTPVRVGSIGYLYDSISNQLFGNSGTGSFILGPDI